MSLGSFCLVLHGHLPWSLHHGHWPHGEVWLFEAAAETYLPLLEMIETCAREGVRTPITLGLTPILLEQLGRPRLPCADVYRTVLPGPGKLRAS